MAAASHLQLPTAANTSNTSSVQVSVDCMAAWLLLCLSQCKNFCL